VQETGRRGGTGGAVQAAALYDAGKKSRQDERVRQNTGGGGDTGYTTWPPWDAKCKQGVSCLLLGIAGGGLRGCRSGRPTLPPLLLPRGSVSMSKDFKVKGCTCTARREGGRAGMCKGIT
jgi:hypothetical protein